jgi:hypothetical protein
MAERDEQMKMNEEPQPSPTPYLRNAQTCPRCGQYNHRGAKFCEYCGEPFTKPPNNSARPIATLLFVLLGVPGCCTSICTYPGLIQFGPQYGYIDWSDYIVPVVAAGVFASTLWWLIHETRKNS